MATKENKEVNDWEILPQEPRAVAGDDWETLPTAAATPKPANSGIGFSGAKDGWWKAIKDKFSENGPESRAAFQSLDFPGGMTRTAAMGLLSLLRGQGVQGSEWKKALGGEATSAPEALQKQGLGAPLSYAVGLPLSVITDPLAAISGASEAKPAVAGLKDALMQNLKQPIAPFMPIAEAGQKTAKGIYQWALRDADKAARKRRGVVGGPTSEYLWNKGEPLVTGLTQNNDEMKAAFAAEGNKKAGMLKEAREGLPDKDFAPAVTLGKINAGEEAVDAKIEALHRHAAEKMKRDYPNPSSVPRLAGEAGEDRIAKRLSELRSALEKKAEDPDDYYFQQIRKQAQDGHVRSLKNRLRRGFLGEENARTDAIEEMKDLVDPRFHQAIDEYHQLFTEGDRDAAKQGLNQLLEDTFAGPRDAESRARLASSYGKVAAGSTPMNTNAYNRNAKMNAKKSGQVGNQRTLSQDLEDDVEAMKGPEAADKYRQDKSDYGKLAGDPKKAFDEKIERARVQKKVTQLDLVLAGLPGAFTGGMHSLYSIPLVAAKKLGVAFNDNPRFGTGAADLLNRTAKTGIWDRMLRRQILDSSKGDSQ